MGGCCTDNSFDNSNTPSLLRDQGRRKSPVERLDPSTPEGRDPKPHKTLTDDVQPEPEHSISTEEPEP